MQRDPSLERERLEAVVVGAGQAGLVMGHFLAEQDRPFVILEAASSVGAAWRTRWDSLVLFTSRRYSGLAGLPFPGDPDGYPKRDEVVAYLERYAERFDLPIEVDTQVRSLTRRGDAWLVALDGRTLEADNVVVATGPFQAPQVPAIAQELSSDVRQLHSIEYRRPSDIPPGGTVLVVGGGNTGYQLAKELAATHDVQLAVGSRQMPLPQRLLRRDLFWWLTKTGIINTTADSRIGRRARQRDSLIGSSPRQLERRYGIPIRPRVVRATERTVVFADGSELAVDTVIWATGFRSDYSWIDAPVFDEAGKPRHRRGVTGAPGLYFLGLTWQHTRGSALIGWVKDDARHIAEQIAARPTAHRHAAGTRRTKEKQAMHEHHRHGANELEHMPTDTTGLPEASRPELVELADGDEFALEIAPVAKRIGDTTVRMLAYNGSIPGPTLRIPEGATVTVHATNRGDLEATVHWHGLRLENRFDGTHDTQAPIPVGERFTYEITVPDPGAYWYHPHIREDYGQELGLYGSILVDPADPGYWPAVHREELLTLDDILIEDGQIAPFAAETTHVAMGRFGNVMLVAGEPDLELTASCGEIVRLYLTNTANTRVFNVTLPGARMKLVGADSGHFEHEELVEEVLIAPSERVVVDVHFPEAGEFALEHRTPERTYRLATVVVRATPAEPNLTAEFDQPRTNADLAAERQRLAPFLDATPDKTLAFVAEMDLGTPEGDVVYACPMHPDVVSEDPGSCPKCGMKLLAVAAPATFACPMHPEVVSESPDRCPKCGMKLVPAGVAGSSEHEHQGRHEHGEHEHGDHGQAHEHGHSSSEEHAEHAHGQGHQHEHAHPEHDHGHSAQGIEWEDDMVEVNRITTPANTRWKLVDRETGAENAAIDWRFTVGDRVKIRLVNELDSDHPMPHPFHVHGAGRFLILARDDVEEPNLAWKDTVLVRTGETVDILLDVSNPGTWMAHCHIAEHHESGMMLTFTVDEAP